MRSRTRKAILSYVNKIVAAASKCKNFVSDGLTGVPDFDLYKCGVAHDWGYHIYHGTNEKNRIRLDREFKQCIAAHDHPVISYMYWIGVRCLGWIFFYFDFSGKHKE